ncbi:DNA-directed RNA polymerase [Rhizobium ruizarguesonis]
MTDMCQNDVTEAGLAFLAELQTDPELKRQFDLEEGMKAEGAARYQRAVDKQTEKGQLGDMVPGKDLIRSNVLLVAEGIREWVAEEEARIAAMTGRGRRQYKLAFRTLKDMSSEAAAYIGLKSLFNGISKQRKTSLLALTIGREIEIDQLVSAFAISHKKLYDKIVEDFTSRSTVHHKRVLRSAIARHAPELLDVETDGKNLSTQEAVGLVVLSAIISKTGLVENRIETSGVKTVDTIHLAEKTIAYVKDRHEVAKFFIPAYKPCVIPPRPWTGLRTGGYHGVLAGRHAIVKGKNRDRKYQQMLRSADLSLVYEGINYLQNTEWKLNQEIFDLMDRFAYVTTLGGLPDVQMEQPQQRLLWLDTAPADRKLWTAEQRKEFSQWKAREASIHEANFEKEGDVSTLTEALETARAFYSEERFYFPWNLDSRGRAYPIARGLQPQGADWQKALLQFAEPMPYDDRARYWLMFHGANCYGKTKEGEKLEKALYVRRVQWIEDNSAFIFKIARDPLGMVDAWSKTDSPWMFLAFCFEYERCETLRRAGLPASTHLAPAFDGSCNGLQHFSAALRDPKGGKSVNLTANEKPEDIYANVQALLVAAVMKAAEEDVGVEYIEEEEADEDGVLFMKHTFTNGGMARRWLAQLAQIDRDLCKQPVMTTPYGSNQQGIKGQIMKRLKERAFFFPALPWSDGTKMSDGYYECSWLAGMIVKAIKKTVVLAKEAMDWLQGIARLTNKANIGIEWTAPSGLPVRQFYEDYTIYQIDTEFMGKLYKPKLIDLRVEPKLSKHEQVNGIAPNFVHSLDASCMLLTIVALGRRGVRAFFMIHDSFAVPAAQADLLWFETRRVFVELYTSNDVLQQFRAGVIEQLPEELHAKVEQVPAKGSLDLNEVLTSDYFFA